MCLKILKKNKKQSYERNRNIEYDNIKSRIVSLPDMKSVKNVIKEIDSQKSITELEKELQEAKLLAETYRKIIEIAEKEFKINIVKKSNTK